MKRWIVMVAVLCVLAAGCGGSSGSSSKDEAAMTQADKIVCKRAADEGTMIPSLVFLDDYTKEWERIERTAKDAHPEFRKAALATSRKVTEQIAYYIDNEEESDSIDTATPYQALLDLCADHNFDLEE